MIRSLFSKFQIILDMNTKLLEKMAVMERALGGEYIFDKAFLESSVSEANQLVYQVIYSLNTLTENRYSDLFDRFQIIKTYLEDILSGGLGPYSGRLTLPYPSIRLEMWPLTGFFSASLAEFGQHLGLQAPDGFVITTTGIRSFLQNNNLDHKIKEIADSLSADKLQNENALLTDIVNNSDIPKELEQAILDEVIKLSDRIGKNTLLAVRIDKVEQEASNQFIDIFDVAPSDILNAFKQCIARYIVKEAESLLQQISEKEISIAVAVYEMIQSKISGTVLTLDPAHSPLQAAGVAVNINNSFHESNEVKEKEEFFSVQRFYPFEPVESKILQKEATKRLPDDKHSLSIMDSGHRRGSSLLRKDNIISIVETAMAVERALGKPQKVFWSQKMSGQIVITQVKPLSSLLYDDISENDSIDDLNKQLEKATVLLAGGETAQMGVATGRLVHVAQDYSYKVFPLGAIAVADKASPNLSPILRRAAGLITETGSSVGHLASIAREVHVPSIVGASGALELLKEGMIVTLDAGECKVYHGIIEPLVRYGSSGMELYPTDPEYITLRQLLRWIIPLNLTDPDSPDFNSTNCQTFHDIIHFSHEMAVEELLNIQTRHKELRGIETRRLKLNIPIDIRVLDIGNGVVNLAAKELNTDDISSLPFKAFLKGLASNEMFDQQPGSIGLREILSGMDKTYTALNTPPEYAGQNLAIIAQNYINLTLRLGYHFNVINAYLSENPNKNFIYYRFVGGFAYMDRRIRRAKFITSILENMDFKVTVTTDLVIGKLKIIDRKYMELALKSLGELTAFSRQLDVKMESEKDVEDFIRLFTKRSKNIFLANRIKEQDQACSK
ncbi:MAG: hypothetical protein KKC46_05280 [Proteobacteria bacterium]|nr:hypothetical protein [Pseudomonadota bacterium]